MKKKKMPEFKYAKTKSAGFDGWNISVDGNLISAGGYSHGIKCSDPNPLPPPVATKPKKHGLSDMLADRYMGKPIAILCARYWYRGILKEVNDEYITLSDPFAVEVTGRATELRAASEDKIPSDIHISPGAVELVCQPAWASFGYENPDSTPAAA